MKPNHRILVVDDDAPLREVVRYALARNDFTVVEATDGEQALRVFAEHRPDLVVLDVNLPRLDGLNVCRELRASSGVPILFLSCRGDEVDRILSLDLGGDDYVTKPFSPRELVSRVKAILRRGEPIVSAEDDLTVGSLRVAARSHQVFASSVEIRLTATEFRILSGLGRARARVLDRAQLARDAYPDRRSVSERTCGGGGRHRAFAHRGRQACRAPLFRSARAGADRAAGGRCRRQHHRKRRVPQRQLAWRGTRSSGGARGRDRS